MRKSSLSAFFGAALAAVASFSGAKANAETINFGIINTESSQNLRQLWDPFLDDMRKETGLDVKAFFSSDYAGIITAMQYGKVQLAWYGNKSAMQAVDRADGEVFVKTMDEAGIGGYYSHLIVRADSPLNSAEDVLKNAATLTFGNGDPNSTSGFLVPGYYVFALNNVDPKKAFKRTLNSNHETNALAVANGQVDVATCNSEALERLGITQPEKRAQLKVVWTSPLIPGDPLVWRKDLDPKVKDTLKTFFLTYGTDSRPNAAQEKAILKALQWAPFQPATNDHLTAVRQLELFKEKTQLEANEAADPAKKAARLKEIDEQLKALEDVMARMNTKN